MSTKGDPVPQAGKQLPNHFFCCSLPESGICMQTDVFNQPHLLPVICSLDTTLTDTVLTALTQAITPLPLQGVSRPIRSI